MGNTKSRHLLILSARLLNNCKKIKLNAIFYPSESIREGCAYSPNWVIIASREYKFELQKQLSILYQLTSGEIFLLSIKPVYSRDSQSTH